MKRTLLKWWISSAIDRDDNYSPWLRDQIERDPELRQFDRDARNIADALRCEADAWCDHHPGPSDRDVSRVPIATPNKPWRTELGPSAATYGAVAAALLLVASLAIFRQPGETGRSLAQNTRHPVTTETAATPVPTDVLSEYIDATQAALQPLAEQWSPAQLIARSKRSLSSQWHLQAQASVEREIERALDGVKSTVDAQWQQVTVDLQSTVEFLTWPLEHGRALLIALGRTG